ncbi:MAG TPA: tRNA (guanosine(46)-N7)-methyltransferase TrmB [Coxiellaceae bacterium]|nr:MAG: tRNA (guanosine(46)-N7)-methyltransferase TrmB [Gammaproteobacteria bacterium RBG_16_37_9]HBC71984.1 tRNA (guanosine(46)-N7)-methyltransferase TrmB [Coxiellaceae bacterium]HBS51508.1 tRNA (guanosine(46)-N7)-methyltransferase TrmB [Coxiellaceae bacterium]HBY56088.1 tRNA (guanosine(46)-N7)-methyltransferase TrmB [Coxiellaceae bacterium]
MKQLKTIRSFIKRQRHLGPTKQKIFDELWPKYSMGITTDQISPKKIFGRSAPLILEIGCGNGETIFSLAQKHPEQDFIGIEIHKPGIASLLAQLKNNPLNNIRIYNEDAVIVLKQCISDHSLDKVLILFPDPWPKKRHHKRRLIQSKFTELLQKKLKLHGILNIATDWEDYANHIMAVFQNNPNFSALDTLKPLPLLHERAPTRFEQKGKSKGHDNFDFWFALKETMSLQAT